MAETKKAIAGDEEGGTYFTPIVTPPIVVRQPSSTESTGSVPSRHVKYRDDGEVRRRQNTIGSETSVDMNPGGPRLGSTFGHNDDGSSNTTLPKVSYVSQKSSASACGLSLYEEDTSSMPTLAAYLRSFTIPGPTEQDQSSMHSKKVS